MNWREEIRDAETNQERTITMQASMSDNRTREVAAVMGMTGE